MDENNKTDDFKDQTIKSLLTTMNDYLERDHVLRKGFLREKRIKTIVYSIIFGLPLIFYLLLYMDVVRTQSVNGDYVALIRIQGVISADAFASADNLVPAIERACDDEKAKGLVLHINSPGGSPVQSDQIYNAIQKCKTTKSKKVVAVGQDTVASGAYWIASSADEFYVNASTITGSIGVKLEGFGVDLTRFASEYGIERRVLTAGENKARGDMFLPQKPQDIEKSKDVLTQLHQNFIDAIELTRKDKLKGDRDELFSGDYWTGKKATELGLADGVADLPDVLEREYQVTNTVDFSPRPSFYDNIRRAASANALADAVGIILGLSTPEFRAM